MTTDSPETMDKRDRVEKTLQGIAVDRPPFTFWWHFPADQVAGEACARAHLEHYRRWDLDFIKVMNDNGYPAPAGGLETPEALRQLLPAPLESPEFQNQLEALRIINRELGDETVFITTLFNPLSVLQTLSGKRAVELIRADREAVDLALGTIAQSLADFADACIQTHAAGVFMSCTDHVLDDAFGPGTYAELVRPHDLTVFEGASAAPMNVVHIHERASDWGGFADYPVRVVHWADRADGPPLGKVADRIDRVMMGGLDHMSTIRTGTPADVRAEVVDAARQAGRTPLILAPGCSFPSDASPENLAAIREALENDVP